MKYEGIQNYVVVDGVPETFWRFALLRPSKDQRAMASLLDNLVTGGVIRAYAARRVQTEDRRMHIRWSVLSIDNRRRDFHTLADLYTWCDGVEYGYSLPVKASG